MDLISIQDTVALNKQRAVQFPYTGEVVDFLLASIDVLTKEVAHQKERKVSLGVGLDKWRSIAIAHSENNITLSGENERLQDVVEQESLQFSDCIDKLWKAEADRDEWKEKYETLDRDLKSELRDPSGTIWECAERLQAEVADLQSSLTLSELHRGQAEIDRATLSKKAEVLRYSLGHAVKELEFAAVFIESRQKQSPVGCDLRRETIVECQQALAEKE